MGFSRPPQFLRVTLLILLGCAILPVHSIEKHLISHSVSPQLSSWGLTLDSSIKNVLPLRRNNSQNFGLLVSLRGGSSSDEISEEDSE